MLKIQNKSSNYWIIKIKKKKKGNMMEIQEVTLKIQTYCSIFQSQ